MGPHYTWTRCDDGSTASRTHMGRYDYTTTTAPHDWYEQDENEQE